jgi:hypothetical protein
MTCKLVEATPAQAIKRCKDAKWPMDLQGKWVRERLRECRCVSVGMVRPAGDRIVISLLPAANGRSETQTIMLMSGFSIKTLRSSREQVGCVWNRCRRSHWFPTGRRFSIGTLCPRKNYFQVFS